jgi:hypothetical protein
METNDAIGTAGNQEGVRGYGAALMMKAAVRVDKGGERARLAESGKRELEIQNRRMWGI